MNKPLSIAMFTSILIHFVLVLLASLIFTLHIDPSLVSRVLVLNLKNPQSERGLTPGKTVKDRPVEAENKELASTTSVTNDHAAEPARVQVEVAAKFAQVAVTESRVSTSTKKRELFVPPSMADPEQPEVEVTPLTREQKKMLDRKFRNWSENYHKLADTENRISWHHGGQQYVARFKRRPAKNSTGKEYVIVNVSTEENGQQLSTEMRMQRLTFSDFAQFVNYWDPRILIHNDEMDGRFHSNSKISVEYTRDVRPKFHGKVTTASGGINVVNRHARIKPEQVFLGGLETKVKRIALPKHAAPFSNASSLRDDQIIYFEQDTHITFYADGTYGWQPAGSDAVEQRVSIAEDAAYIIAKRKRKLFVKGVVSGRVLVYSPERIVIEGDLTYAHDPKTRRNADDYLGLVSDKNITVAAPAVTGRGDLSVYASIYAKRRFAVKSYWRKEAAMLLIYGSLTAGSLSATEPRYRTKIQFDKRLESARPPGFPMTNRYEVEYQDADWRIERAAVSP